MNGLQITYYLKGEDITKNVFFAGERPEIFSLTQKKCVNDYQYAYTDHLGNVRMIYTSNPGETTFAANMEAVPNEADDEFFDGTNNTADVLATSGTSVTRLMAGQVSGPALTALPVYPGDTIAMQVQGFYRGGSGTSTVDIPTLIAAVAGSFGGLNGGTTAEQTIFNAFDQAINPALGGFGIQTAETGEVAAYLNYIMFDKNMQMVQHGHWPMDDDALANPMLIKMEPAPVAKEEGFIYVYLTNESDSEIYFDDFEVTLKESLVVQNTNYYPFGLTTSDSWTRPTDLKNNFLYNAGSELNEETQNYETFYRQYDAAIGRFTAVDIMASKYSSHTPYNYCFNDPVALNDPMGDDVWADMQAWAQGVIEENRSFLYNDGIGSNNAYGYGNNFGAGYGLSSASRRSGYAIGSGYSMSSLNSFASEVSMKRFLNEHVKSVVLDYNMYSGTSSGGGSMTLGTRLVEGTWTNHWGDNAQSTKTGNLLLFISPNSPYGNALVDTKWNAASPAYLDLAVEAVDNYVKDGTKLNNLVIISHGSERGVRLGYGEDDDISVGSFKNDSESAKKLKAITDNIQAGGNLVFNACLAGQQTITHANDYLNANRNGTINIFMNQDYSKAVEQPIGKRTFMLIHFNKGLTKDKNMLRGWLHIRGSKDRGKSYKNLIINKNGSINPVPWY